MIAQTALLTISIIEIPLLLYDYLLGIFVNLKPVKGRLETSLQDLRSTVKP